MKALEQTRVPARVSAPRARGRRELSSAARAATPAWRPKDLTPSSPTYLQRHLGNEALGSLLAAGPRPSGDAQKASNWPSAPSQIQRGSRDASALPAFPYAQPIERLLGSAIPGHAVVDRQGCERAGAVAFTEGTITHFASDNPPLDVAAHEAVHQLQHAGRTNDLGLGAERHAAAVERRVRDGVSAASHLGHAGAPVPVSRRLYTEVPVASQKPGEWNAGVDVRVSDDGRMAAEQAGAYGTHKLWAQAALITSANATLTAKGSVIRLRAGAGVTGGSPPDGTSVTRVLVEVQPENVATGTSGDTMSLWADCGRSARDVVGVGGGTGKNYNMVTAMYGASGKTVETSASAPEGMADEIVKETLGAGLSAPAGWAKYHSLAPADRDAFDKKTGINRYAAPQVGEGYTMKSGGTPFPGVMTWNFHWAGVVMRSGADSVTLENYAVGAPDAVNTDWNFQMYGSAAKAGQTFHDQHLASKQHGDDPTSMAVRKR